MKQKHNVDKFLKAVQLCKNTLFTKTSCLTFVYKTLLIYNPFNIYIVGVCSSNSLARYAMRYQESDLHLAFILLRLLLTILISLLF